MNEQEIKSLDLYTIYKLIDVHAEIKSPKTNRKSKSHDEEKGAYIDNLLF